MLRHFLNLILPRRCPLCHQEIAEDQDLPFCPSCAAGISLVTGPCCPTCGRPLPSPDLLEENPSFQCGACRHGPVHLDSARSLVYFYGSVQQGIRLFKYGGHWKLGRDLIRGLGMHIRKLPLKADLIVPVPLHPLRLRRRGFNQAVVLAREISAMRAIPMELDLLARTRNTRPQVGLKGRERHRNIRGSFRVIRKDRIRDRSVLLVDDVLTTGATANECARVLKEAEAEQVHLVALAGTGEPL